jgi:hypothetical protein
MPELRKLMFPYGIEKNPDGSWTVFNRQYKPVGVVTRDHAEWDDPRHKVRLKGLGPAKLRKLDIRGEGASDRIYFYNDATVPTSSAEGMARYLEKLKLLMSLEAG